MTCLLKFIHVNSRRYNHVVWGTNRGGFHRRTCCRNKSWRNSSCRRLVVLYINNFIRYYIFGISNTDFNDYRKINIFICVKFFLIVLIFFSINVVFFPTTWFNIRLKSRQFNHMVKLFCRVFNNNYNLHDYLVLTKTITN